MPAETPDGDGWSGYRRLILRNFEQLGEQIVSIETKIDRLRDRDISDMKIDIAMLKVKAGMWGAVGGAAGGAIIAVLVGRLFR